MLENIDERNIVKFKSAPFYYSKEKAGLKPNTVRRVESDERFSKLTNRTAHFITIQNSKNGKQFIRRITDISFWEGLVIISWEAL